MRKPAGKHQNNYLVTPSTTGRLWALYELNGQSIPTPLKFIESKGVPHINFGEDCV